MPSSSTIAESRLAELTELQSGEREAYLRSLGDPRDVLTELSEAALRLVISDLGLALKCTEVLVQLADRLDAPIPRIRARRSRAQALAYASRFAEALECLTEAVEAAHRHEKPVEEALVRMTRLHALAKQGRYAEAVDEGERARAVFLRHGATELAARADINLGVTRRMQDQPAQAIDHFVRARAGVAHLPDIVAQLDSNLAEALLDSSRFEEAEEAFRAALAAFETLGARHAAGIVDGNLGDLMSRQGRLDDALRHFERARRSLEAVDSTAELARLIAEQAEALASSGMAEEALATYDGAIPMLRDFNLRWDEARALTGRGRTCLDLHRLDEAEESLRRAAEVFSELAHDTGSARADLLLGRLAMMRNQRGAARDHFITALRLVGPDSSEAIVAKLNIASIALMTDNLRAAEVLVEEALDVARELALLPHQVDLLQLRGRIRIRTGDIDNAIADWRIAAEQLERLRGRFGTERFRAAFFGSRVSVYEDLALALIRRDAAGDLVEAFNITERARGRTLLEIIRGSGDLLRSLPDRKWGEDDRHLVSRAAALEASLNALYQSLDPLSKTAWAGGSHAERVDLIDRTERELLAIESRLTALSAVGEAYAQPVRLEELGDRLGPDVAVVAYACLGERLHAFTIRNGGELRHHDVGRLESIGQSIDRFRFQIERALSRVAAGRPLDEPLRQDALAQLQDLHSLLIAPLDDRIERADRLAIIPAGPLHTVPFHAIYDGQRHLIQRGRMAMAPSLSVLVHLLERPASSSDDGGRSVIAGFADDAAPQLSAELEMVSQRLPGGTVLRGDEATSGALRNAASGATHLHLACHARFSPHSPRLTGLLLADGWMTLPQLTALRLRNAFVLLTGCESGAVRVDHGNEIAGLPRVLLTAGASSIAMSLWPVVDESMRFLVERFYDLWQNPDESGSASGSLRGAQLACIRRELHPAIWAPFVLVGEP